MNGFMAHKIKTVQQIKKYDVVFHTVWAKCSFSPREFDILACLLHEKSSKKIASLLDNITARTVNAHINTMNHKAGVRSRGDLVLFIEKYGDLDTLNVHYAKALRVHNFKEALQKTAENLRGQRIMCRILCANKPLLEKIQLNLKKGGIKISDEMDAKTIHIVLPEAVGTETETDIGTKEDLSGFDKSVVYTGNDELLFFEIVDYLCPSAEMKDACAYFRGEVITGHLRSDRALPLPFRRRWMISTLYVVLVFLLLCLCGFLYTKMANSAVVPDATCAHSIFAIPDNAHRFDRKRLMSKIAACFKENKGIQTAVLIGIGGSGKTMLTRQYARHQHCPVIWEVNAETKNSLIESFEQLAYATSKTADEKTELSRIKSMTHESEKKKFLVFFVQRNFRNIKKPWCLIFDNVERFSDIQEFFPNDAATWGRGQVLITTQNEHIINNPQIGNHGIVHVGEFSDQERFAFFAKLVFGSENPALSHEAKQEAILFLRNIPPYPLDISLAAHDITANQLTYQQCIERQKSTNLEFEKMPHQFFADDVSDYKKTRYSTIVTNMKSLIQACPKFQELFFMIALVGSQRIPKDLLLACLDQQTVDRFIDHMKKLSFMTQDQACHQIGHPVTNTLSLHRSTQDVILTYFGKILNKQERDAISLRAIEALERYTEPFIAEVNISKARSVLNHLLIALKHHDLLTTLGRGILNLQLGRIYYCLYDLKNASLFSESSLNDLQAYYQKTVHIRLARALACFGIANKMVTNDYRKGMRCLEKSLKLYEQYFPGSHEELAWVLLQLGDTYVIIDDNKKAEAVLAKGMAIYSQYHNADYSKVAWGLLYQGNMARLSGDYTGAEQFYKKSCALFEKNHGKNHPKTMWTRIRLAVTYVLAGKLAEAKNLLESLPLTYEKQATENHDNMIWKTFCLGEIYRQLGCYTKANQLLDQSFQICGGSYSEVYTAWWPTVHLGKLYIDLGDYAAAENLLIKSFITQKKHIGLKHIRASGTAHQLANVYTKTGRFKEAEKLFTHVLAHYQKYYGANHLECAHLLCDFGQFYLLQNDYVRGKAHIDQAQRIFSNYNHPDRYRCFEVVGDFYLSSLMTKNGAKDQGEKEVQKSVAAAIDHFKAARDIVRLQFPKNSAHTARIMRKIQKVLSLQEYDA